MSPSTPSILSHPLFALPTYTKLAQCLRSSSPALKEHILRLLSRILFFIHDAQLCKAKAGDKEKTPELKEYIDVLPYIGFHQVRILSFVTSESNHNLLVACSSAHEQRTRWPCVLFLVSNFLAGDDQHDQDFGRVLDSL